MSIYLDSAIISEAKIACRRGWIAGITTNPTLLAKSEDSPEITLKNLAELTSGEVFYQLTSNNVEDMITEGKVAFNLIGKQTVLKIPATEMGFEVVAKLSPEIACSVTAIYSPSQAIIAKEAGAKYAIAYVNRATRFLGDGLILVQDMAKVLTGSNTEILAASIKSPIEAVATMQAGAHHLTLPLAILEQMTTNKLSEDTVIEFNQNGKGITWK